MGDENLSVAQASRIVNKAPKTIRRWIAQGILPARRPGRDYIISRRDLDECGRRDPANAGSTAA